MDCFSAGPAPGTPLLRFPLRFSRTLWGKQTALPVHSRQWVGQLGNTLGMPARWSRLGQSAEALNERGRGER